MKEEERHMKKLMVGLFAVAAVLGAYGADQVSWFTEDATTVAAALEAEGKTDDGTWTQMVGLSVADSLIQVDAEEAPVAYAPDAELKGDTATLTFEDVSFGAAYTVDQLPVLDENAQVGVVLKATDDGAVFAVVENGSWYVTDVPANPETSYTIVCEISYANKTVTYSYGTTTIATVGDTAEKRISTLNIGGSGSLASLGATRAELVPAPATVTDTEPPTIGDLTYDVAKTFTSGDPIEKAEDFEGWTADFVVTVDKDVEAGALALAGALDSMWVPLEMGALKAGEPFMLLKSLSGEDVPYGGVVAMQEFPCALANLDVTNDTTITVTLLAMKGSVTNELASFDYLIKAKPVGPKSNEGTIAPADPSTGIAEFTPTDPAVTEVTIDLGDFTGKIAIPSTIEMLKGVPADQIIVKNAKGHQIDAAAFIGGDANGYSTELTPAAQKPAFDKTEDGETAETPFVITDGDVALGVKTIAGLTYQLKKSTTLGASAKWTNVGDPIEGDGNAMALRAEKAAQDPAAFYKVEVTK